MKTPSFFSNGPCFLLLVALLAAPSASGVEILVVGNSYTSYSGANKSANVLAWCIEEEIASWMGPQISR